MTEVEQLKAELIQWKKYYDQAKAGYRNKLKGIAELVAGDAQGKIGLVPGNTAFENGRFKAATEILAALETQT